MGTLPEMGVSPIFRREPPKKHLAPKIDPHKKWSPKLRPLRGVWWVRTAPPPQGPKKKPLNPAGGHWLPSLPNDTKGGPASPSAIRGRLAPKPVGSEPPLPPPPSYTEATRPRNPVRFTPSRFKLSSAKVSGSRPSVPSLITMNTIGIPVSLPFP